MLSLALDQLIPLLPVLIANFDAAKMLRSEDGCKVDASIIKETKAALETEHFTEFCEMVRTTGKILEQHGHRLEGCECHRAIWTAMLGTRGKKASAAEGIWVHFMFHEDTTGALVSNGWQVHADQRSLRVHV